MVDAWRLAVLSSVVTFVPWQNLPLSRVPRIRPQPQLSVTTPVGAIILKYEWVAARVTIQLGDSGIEAQYPRARHRLSAPSGRFAQALQDR